MLLNLHVQDLALIKDIDVGFEAGLNILTGETGAGKSIILGSINLALGGKVSSDLIRKGAQHALVELVFIANSPELAEWFQNEDIPFENKQIIISRKIMNGHSISKVNGVTVTLSKLRQITSNLVDIHGQHDHQSLLNKSKHLEILDTFGGQKVSGLLCEVEKGYKKLRTLKQELKMFDLDGEQRLREMSLIEYEINEIETAGLMAGEDENLEVSFKKLSNGRKILDALSYTDSLGISDKIGEALKAMKGIAQYDDSIQLQYEQLLELESLFSDFSRGLSEYMDEMSYEDGALEEVEARLNQINKLKSKYGKSILKILEYKEKSFSRMEILRNYETQKESLEKAIRIASQELDGISQELSDCRKEAAVRLTSEIMKSLKDLNFNDVQFQIDSKPMPEVSLLGKDNVEFLISTNPGESIRPLREIASGGELSRIMLAIKTIMAQKDSIDTLIFDEIDTGISGRTAGRVASKLSQVSMNHQVLCITHLPQIASMADVHYRIEKKVIENSTVVEVTRLENKESVEEISRILGGDRITEIIRKNAMEMLQEAENLKKTFKPVGLN